MLFKTGELCLDILKPASWTPAWTLENVCVAVRLLLSSPEDGADSPLNCDCGAPPHAARKAARRTASSRRLDGHRR